MPRMGDVKLTATFNKLDESAVKRLGAALGALAQGLYESGHNLQQDPLTGHAVLFVCMEGRQGAGKSTLSHEILSCGLGAGIQRGNDSGIFPTTHDLGDSRTVLIWESCWSEAAGQQNRVRDCWLTAPFNASFHMKERPVPPRHLPGIEVLEHGRLVPRAMQGLVIEMEIDADETRAVSVTLPHPSGPGRRHWEAFLQQAGSPALTLEP